MLVSELQEKIDSTPSVPVTTYLSNVRVEGDTIDLNGTEVEFTPKSRLVLSDFLGAPTHYIKKLPGELAATLLNHHLDGAAETQGIFQTFGEDLLSVSDPEAKALPLRSYVQAVTNVFQPSDEVVTFDLSDRNELVLDVTTSRFVEVLGDGSERRPRVDDITRGGVRLVATPDNEKPPVVSSYLHRLVCTNGLTVQEEAAKISLRAKNAEDIFRELENAMTIVLGNLDSRLSNYADTARLPIEGDRSLLMFNLVSERNLPRKVLQRVMDLTSELPDDASVYDAIQVVTEVANEQARFGNKYKLQAIGGELSDPNSGLLHRCTRCEHLLTPAYSKV